MSLVLPFPRARNRPYVMRQAMRMAAMTQKGAEGHLTYQLTIFRGSLLRRSLLSLTRKGIRWTARA
jgi:hypothetical protein